MTGDRLRIGTHPGLTIRVSANRAPPSPRLARDEPPHPNPGVLSQYEDLQHLWFPQGAHAEVRQTSGESEREGVGQTRTDLSCGQQHRVGCQRLTVRKLRECSVTHRDIRPLNENIGVNVRCP